jgi:hypothetical protein|tara:strand:- start:353 stop:1771 length:1419 start_codon:yes stop_codon:yes gene_type:complete
MAKIKSHQFYQQSPLLGARSGQEAIDRANETSSRRRMAEKLLEGSSGPRRIGHWTQGLAQLAESGIGAYLQNKADEEHDARQAKYDEDYSTIMRGFRDTRGEDSIRTPGVGNVSLPGSVQQKTEPIPGSMQRALEIAQGIDNPDTSGLLNDLTMAQYQNEQAALAAAAQRKQDLADATLIRTQTLDDATLKHDRDMEKVRGKLTSFEQTLLNAGIERGSEEWNDAYAKRIAKLTRDTPGVVVNTGQQKPPTGFRWTAEGSLEQIPGGPAAIQAAEVEKTAAAELEAAEQEAAEEDKRAQVAMESTASTQFVMENALDGAFAALDDADDDPLSFGASGTLSQVPALRSSSHAGRLRSHIATLRSPIVMQGIEKLRASSSSGATGFGAMNEAELKILTEMLGALDPDTTDPDILRKTLEGVRTQVEIVKADVLREVEPYRLHELGLGDWLPEAKQPTLDELRAERKRRKEAAAK